MRRNIATPHLSDRPPQCHQHKNRQQMDGAENANNLRFMNKKAADCDERHQSGPDVAKLPVPWRSLGHTQLEATEDKRKHSRAWGGIGIAAANKGATFISFSSFLIVQIQAQLVMGVSLLQGKELGEKDI